MVKRWLGVALVAIGLGGTASAQNPYVPNTGQATGMPEPIPFSNPLAGLPGSVPVPGSCPTGPEEPPSSLAQRGDVPNAWAEGEPRGTPAVYFSVGFVGYTRERPGHTQAAVFDFGNGGVDNGNTAPLGSREVLNFHDISPRMDAGTKLTLGYHWDTSAVEFSGFYVGQSHSAKEIDLIGALDAPFNVNGSFTSFPRGFEGNNGLWLQADVMKLSLQTALGSGEVNYRWWLGSDSNFSWSLGVRYLDLYERFDFYTGDDDITVRDIFKNPDPTREALYSTTAHNRLAAPQLGLEWSRAINCWLAFTVSAKGAWGANFLETETLLKRGDGFVGFRGERNQTIFSHMYELGIYADFCLCDNMRLRAGYNFLWAVDIAEAQQQVDYNLNDHFGANNTRGSVLYQGPAIELHILF